MRILLLCIVAAFAVGQAGAAGNADADPGEVPSLGGEPDLAEMRAGRVAVAETLRRRWVELEGRLFADIDATRQAEPVSPRDVEVIRYVGDVPYSAFTGVAQQPAAEVIQTTVSDEDKALAAAIMDRVSAQDLYESGAVRLPEMVVYFNKLHIFSCGNVSLDGYHAKGAKEKEKAIARALSLLPVEYEIECCVNAEKVYVNSLHVCQQCGAFVSPVVVQAWKNKCPYCMKEPLL